MARSNRPLEIFLVAVLILVAAVIRLLVLAAVAVLPEVREAVDSLGASRIPSAIVQVPLFVHYLTSVLGAIVFLCCGIGLLRAHAWSRNLLLVWAGWSLLFTFLTTGSLGYITPGILSFALLLILLFTPRAAAYFRS